MRGGLPLPPDGLNLFWCDGVLRKDLAVNAAPDDANFFRRRREVLGGQGCREV
jgi:hypothetical protein